MIGERKVFFAAKRATNREMRCGIVLGNACGRRLGTKETPELGIVLASLRLGEYLAGALPMG